MYHEYMALSEDFLSASMEQGLTEVLPVVSPPFRRVFVLLDALRTWPSTSVLSSGRAHCDEMFALQRSAPIEYAVVAPLKARLEQARR